MPQMTPMRYAYEQCHKKKDVCPGICKLNDVVIYFTCHLNIIWYLNKKEKKNAMTTIMPFISNFPKLVPHRKSVHTAVSCMCIISSIRSSEALLPQNGKGATIKQLSLNWHYRQVCWKINMVKLSSHRLVKPNLGPGSHNFIVSHIHHSSATWVA